MTLRSVPIGNRRCGLPQKDRIARWQKEIGECVEAVFERRQRTFGSTVPSYLRDSVEEYGRLPDIEPHLTHREIEIVRFAAEGMTVKETAFALMLSHRTVTGHLCNVYKKFGIHNMVGVLKLAVSKGILPVDEIMRYGSQS